MTLRSDIHESVDQHVPPAPWLAGAVWDAIDEGRRPRRASQRIARWATGAGRAGGLVAAAVAVALIVALLLLSSGRFQVMPRPAPAAPGVDKQALAVLEARPFSFSKLAPGQACPIDSALTAVVYSGALQDVHGSGPVYFEGSLWTQVTAWGGYAEDVWFTDSSLNGPVLVRARDLTTGEDLVFTGDHAAGPIVRHDVLEGKSVEQHSELVLDTSSPPSGTANGGRLHVWYAVDGISDQGPHCEAWQIDGFNFSETMVLLRSSI